MVHKTTRRGIPKRAAENESERDGELSFANMLRCRIRYFTDGAVIGSRMFVDEAFAKSPLSLRIKAEVRCETTARLGCDFPAGMTDGYAASTYKHLFSPDFG